ncbi:MAG: hypothetical protein AAB656_01395 [Patescibacteria group bacterium]
MRIILKIGLPILIAVIFVFLPVFVNSDLLLNRNNDLTEFFWPIFYYLKENILVNNRIPVTNEMWFAGTPLISDPQNPIWYLPNLIFLSLPIDTAIITSLFIHSLFGTIGMYLASRKVFNFTEKTSVLLAVLFIFSPIFFSFLEAGHWGLAIAWNWLPYFLLSSYILITKPSWKIILLFATSASSLYFNHVLTAIIAAIPVGIFWLYKKKFKYTTLASILAFVFILPAFYYQMSWQGQTTRDLLLTNPETFPIWRGKIEFLRTLFIFNPATEKAITFGIIPTILAFFGFLKLKLKNKLILASLLLILLLIALNNVSPIYQLLINLNPFILMRVAIRVWFIAFFPLLFLIGFAIESLPKRIGIILGSLAIINSIQIGYLYFSKPVSPRENIPQQIYEILEKDKSDFRIFCLTRCIPQKEAAIRNLKLVEGYGTLQEKSYFEKMQKILNSKWDKYTLSVPPFDVYLYQKPQPNAKLLSEMGTKYVIVKYTLIDSKFRLLGKFSEYHLYYIR